MAQEKSGHPILV